VTESEVKNIRKDGHDDSDETGIIGSSGTIEDLDPEEVHENISQNLQKDSQENADENGNIGSNDSIEGNLKQKGNT